MKKMYVSKEKLSRAIIYAVNGLFVVFGFLLALWGIVTIKSTGGFENIEDGININTLPVLAILLGFAIIAVATLGIVGTIYENYLITSVYSVILVIVTILQITLVLWMFTKRESFLHNMDQAVKSAFDDNSRERNYPFDPLELAFHCCGLHNYQDYSDKVPKTCCGIPRSQPRKCKANMYTKRPGCRSLFQQFWETNISLVGGAGIVIILLEFGLIYIAYTLLKKYRNSQKANLSTPEEPNAVSS